MKTTREGYQAQMEEKLAEWSTGLEKIRARAEGAGADTKKELLARLAELTTGGRRQSAPREVAAAASDSW